MQADIDTKEPYNIVKSKWGYAVMWNSQGAKPLTDIHAARKILSLIFDTCDEPACSLIVATSEKQDSAKWTLIHVTRPLFYSTDCETFSEELAREQRAMFSYLSQEHKNIGTGSIYSTRGILLLTEKTAFAVKEELERRYTWYGLGGFGQERFLEIQW